MAWYPSNRLSIRCINRCYVTVIFIATGQQAYVMALCTSCDSVHLSVHATHILFSETSHPIFKKLHRNDPVLVLFEIPLGNFIPSKSLVAMATKLSLKIFLSETIRPRATEYGM